MQYRHGDLLIISIESIPKGAKKKQGKVIMEGEATGHAHVLDDGVLFEKDGRLYFDVKKARTTLRQTSPVKDDPDTHDPILIPRGRFMVIQERNYMPGPVPVQRVVD